MRAGLLAAILAASPWSSPVPIAAALVACPIVVSHRTQMLDAPENTLPGIVAAGLTDSPMVEIDVQWSNTDFPILMHDQTVDRTTNGTGTVAGKGLGQLTALKAQDYAPWSADPRFTATKVPYGWDFMNAISTAGLDALIELGATPSQASMAKLVHYIDVFSYRSRVWIMAPADRVATIRPWFPDLKYVVIEYPPSGMMRTGESLAALGAWGYALPSREIHSPAIVDYYHAHGLKVLTWTSDTPVIDVPASWDRVTAAGVDYLITNRTEDALARQGVTCN